MRLATLAAPLLLQPAPRAGRPACSGVVDGDTPWASFANFNVGRWAGRATGFAVTRPTAGAPEASALLGPVAYTHVVGARRDRPLELALMTSCGPDDRCQESLTLSGWTDVDVDGSFSDHHARGLPHAQMLIRAMGREGAAVEAARDATSPLVIEHSLALSDRERRRCLLIYGGETTEDTDRMGGAVLSHVLLLLETKMGAEADAEAEALAAAEAAMQAVAEAEAVVARAAEGAAAEGASAAASSEAAALLSPLINEWVGDACVRTPVEASFPPRKSPRKSPRSPRRSAKGFGKLDGKRSKAEEAEAESATVLFGAVATNVFKGSLSYTCREVRSAMPRPHISAIYLGQISRPNISAKYLGCRCGTVRLR